MAQLTEGDGRKFIDYSIAQGRGLQSWFSPDKTTRDENRRQLIDSVDKQVQDQYGGWNNFYPKLSQQYIDSSNEIEQQYPSLKQQNMNQLNNAHYVLPNGQVGPSVIDHNYMDRVVLSKLGINPNFTMSDDQFGPQLGGTIRVINSGSPDKPAILQLFYYPNVQQLETLEKYYPDRRYFIRYSTDTVQGLKAALAKLRQMHIGTFEESRPQSLHEHEQWLWDKQAQPQV